VKEAVIEGLPKLLEKEGEGERIGTRGYSKLTEEKPTEP